MVRNEQHDLLEVLKTELRFLQDGGYRHAFRNDWGPQFVFENSPTCMNYGVCAGARVPCCNCVLMPLIPPEQRFAKSPCRRIPLNAAGESLDDLYRHADEYEIEIAVEKWLRLKISAFEREKAAAKTDSAD